MKIKSTLHICCIVFLMLFACNKHIAADNVVATVKSPDGNIELKLLLDNSMLYYQVNKGAENVVAKSKLGINTSVADFSSGLSFVNVSSDSKDESYTLPSGKKSTYINKYNEIKATFSKSSRNLQVIVRAYDDGIAYRYGLEGSGNLTVQSESSECNVASNDKIYSQVYSKDYKNDFEESDWDRESCLKSTSLPLLIKTRDNYVLISEAMVNGSYSASKLVADDDTDGFAYSIASTVSTTLPFQSPWRTMTIGSLNTVVESIMPENLNPSTEITDISWIKPGRAVWNYGGEDTFGYLTIANIRSYMDWAQEMGWEYFTLDMGWQNSTLTSALNYAKTKGIGVFIWVNQNKLSTNRTTLQTTLRSWKNQGVTGLKIDFWEDDSQDMMKRYDLLLELAAEQNLMVNFHSCTKPTGLRKTWPHLLTSEAVLSNAYYAQSPNMVTAAHNINSAIIRNALGATDYNPIDFADKYGKIFYGTTWAHQLALSVVFESGIQHLIDTPDNIRYNIAVDFLKTLPVAWDDTKCLEAIMDDRITVARKKGQDWYVASLINESGIAEIDLSFLSSDKTYNAFIYRDGNCPSEIRFQYKENLGPNDKIKLSLLSNGGFAMILSPSDSYKKPLHVKYEAESSDNDIPFGVAIKVDTDSLCSNGRYVTSIGKGRALTFQKITVPESGTYALTFYYMAESDGNAYVKVNGMAESQKEYSFMGTLTGSGSGLAHKTIFVELDASIENTIEFGNSTDFAPNLDRIVIAVSDDAEVTNIETINTNEEAGKVYVVGKDIVIEQKDLTKYQVYNSLGQIVTSGKFDGGIVSIPIPDSGVYLIRINTNNLDFSKKLIIR